MKTLLLSIKPEYVEKIFDESKKFEFRKVKPNEAIEKILFYATSPVKKVVGEAEVLEILVDTPKNIWEITKNFSGISKKKYDAYFFDHKKSVAFHLGKMRQYNHKKDLIELGIRHAPQSFVYYNE